jgi:pimeloyl-ACP methyl ester carboxylesterase
MRKGYADTALGQLHFVEDGKGAKLTLLGPAPRSWRVFVGLISLLAARLHVVVVEPPGFGESDPTFAGASMEEVADAMAEALAQIGLSETALFGLHSGAKLAAAVAARHPRLIGQLILCGKSHSIAPIAEVRNRATRAAVERQYFVEGAGLSAEGDARRAWAAHGRNVSALWWSDRLFAAGANPKLFDAAAAKIADGLIARATVLGSYDANFAFDFASAVRSIHCPLTILEITSEAEDAAIGRQGEQLAALVVPRPVVMTFPDIDRDGLDLHAGIENLARTILGITCGAKG